MKEKRDSQLTLEERNHILMKRMGYQNLVEKLRKIDDARRYKAASEIGPSIFQEELQRVQNMGAIIPHPDLLIMAVGYSPEPLLLAVAYHQPAKVILLLEKSLKEDYLVEFRKLWRDNADFLSEKSIEIQECPVIHSPKQEAANKRTGVAASMFQEIRQSVEEASTPREKIILDITGAKKSMVAGAFLAAGFLGIQASYVDFSVYDRDLGRPQTDSVFVNHLENPYQIFLLREERQLEDAFDQRRFDEARHFATRLAEMAQDPQVVDILGNKESERLTTKYHRVRDAAQAYLFWSEGFFANASRFIDQSNELPPAEIPKILGAVWPDDTDEEREIVKQLKEERVFSDPLVPLAYFLDVLVWNSPRRVEEQPRVSFLRLFGAVESLLSFIVFSLTGRNGERLEIAWENQEPEQLNTLKEKYPKGRWDKGLRKAAAEFLRENSRIGVDLLKGETSRLDMKRLTLRRPCGSYQKEARETLQAFAVKLVEAPFSPPASLADLAQFTGLRNKVVHWMAPVPQGFALQLLELYRSFLTELVPHAVSLLVDDDQYSVAAESQKILAFSRRVQEAAKDDVRLQAFGPPLFNDLLAYKNNIGERSEA